MSKVVLEGVETGAASAICRAPFICCGMMSVVDPKYE